MAFMGLGLPEILLIAIAVGIFFFGAPKIKEWVNTFKGVKTEAQKVRDE